MNQVGSTYLSECLECPANSMSEKGFSEICPCEEGFSRIKLNASLPCEGECWCHFEAKTSKFEWEVCVNNGIPAVSS